MKRCAEFIACALVAAAFFAPRGAVAQTPAPAAPKKDKSQRLIANFPVPVGQKSMGIVIPDWENGESKMSFNVDMMEHKDIEHIQMTNAKIQTFDEEGKLDLVLLLPVSVFDLKTCLLTTDKPFVLKRADFELMGDALELDTLARQATITGKVKIIIYNFEEPTRKETPHE